MPKRAANTYALENHRIARPRLGNDIPLDPTKRIRAVPIRQHPIPPGSLVNNRNVARSAIILHRRQHVIRPAIIMIIPAPASIRNTIANNHKTARFGRRPRLQRLNEPPMLLRRHRISRDVLRVDLVAGAVPAVDAGARVARDVVAGLAVLQVDGDGEFGLRRDVEVERVGDGETLVGDRDGAVATEGDVLDCGGLDQGGAGARGVRRADDGAVESCGGDVCVGEREAGGGCQWCVVLWFVVLCSSDEHRNIRDRHSGDGEVVQAESVAEA